jgi:translation initiation factor IF-3
LRINRRIRSRELRVVDEDGKQRGVVAIDEALKMAMEAGLDLVEVAPQLKPPVARIMDYSKYKYEQEKKEREAKKRQHVIHIKEIKIGPKIEEHDYQVKLHHAEKFLKRGDKTKVTMRFRGRQMVHIDLGRKVLDRLSGDVAAFGELEMEPKLEGRVMTMVIKPKK